MSILVLCLWCFWGLPSILYPVIGEIRQQISNLDIALSRVKSALEVTEENTVIMTYDCNLIHVFYGNRSVLNYGRIPRSDPVTEQYRYDLFEPCLVYAVDLFVVCQAGLFP